MFVICYHICGILCSQNKIAQFEFFSLCFDMDLVRFFQHINRKSFSLHIKFCYFKRGLFLPFTICFCLHLLQQFQTLFGIRLLCSEMSTVVDNSFPVKHASSWPEKNKNRKGGLDFHRVAHHIYKLLAAKYQTAFPVVNLLKIQVTKPMCTK